MQISASFFILWPSLTIWNRSWTITTMHLMIAWLKLLIFWVIHRALKLNLRIGLGSTTWGSRENKLALESLHRHQTRRWSNLRAYTDLAIANSSQFKWSLREIFGLRKLALAKLKVPRRQWCCRHRRMPNSSNQGKYWRTSTISKVRWIWRISIGTPNSCILSPSTKGLKIRSERPMIARKLGFKPILVILTLNFTINGTKRGKRKMGSNAMSARVRGIQTTSVATPTRTWILEPMMMMKTLKWSGPWP